MVAIWCRHAVPEFAVVAAGGATNKSICGRAFRSSVTLKTTVIGWPSAIGARLASSSACLDWFQSAANWSGAPTKSVVRRATAPRLARARS